MPDLGLLLLAKAEQEQTTTRRALELLCMSSAQLGVQQRGSAASVSLNFSSPVLRWDPPKSS